MSRWPRILTGPVLLLTLLIAALPAQGSVHFMQIQRLVGGVDGDLTAQAIQLRMRDLFQNQTQSAILILFDATGGAPIVLASPTTPVSKQGTGVNILFATSSFASKTDPPAVPDFTMNAIPASYLAAGSLVWGNNLGDVWWRVSWGGAAYTGPGVGPTFNDADGQFNPPYAGALPTASTTALDFTGTAGAFSTNNAADYEIGAPLESFRNNAGTVFTLKSGATPTPPVELAAVRLLPAAPNPFNPRTWIRYRIPLEGWARIRVFDAEGSLVDVLHDGVLPAGPGRILWTGVDQSRRPVASGVYYVRLQGPGGVATRAVTLIK